MTELDWSPLYGCGRGADPKPLTTDSKVIALATCPDCNGRGWFLINPFSVGGSNGAGGIANMTQCLTCKSAEEYFKEHGELPPGIPWPE